MQHPDEADLLGYVSGKVSPVPRFNYRQVKYDDVELGIIEIPSSQPGLIIPRVDFGVLRKDVVYIRRNTTNTEATSDDYSRITKTTERKVEPDTAISSGTWERFYRVCDGFDARRVYIAVVDVHSRVDAQDWEAMANVHWNIVVDFDTITDLRGNFAVAESAFRDQRSTQISALDQDVRISSRSTIWVAAAGLDSRPTTNPSVNWRDWNRSKRQPLEKIMVDLAKLTEPMPATLVVFGGERRHVNSTCEIVDSVFAHRVEYVFANTDRQVYEEIADNLDGHIIPIGLPDVCQGLKDLQQESGRTPQKLLPKLGGGTVGIETQSSHWVEERLETIHQGIEQTQDELLDQHSFLKGTTISWVDLNAQVDVQREVTARLEREIYKLLAEQGTRSVNLRHWPGAGGTTIARRIGWNIHREFPTVVALEIQPQETTDRIKFLYDLTRKPILVIIDLPLSTKEVVDRLYDELRRSHVPAVLFNIERRFDSSVAPGMYYLDAMLTTQEAVALSSILSLRVPSRRPDLERLIDERDRRKRTPFYFGLVAFGKEFRGLESYVHTRLSRASHPLDDALTAIAFAYYYGQVALTLQTFVPIFNLSTSRLISSMSEVFPDYLQELIVETRDGVRPAHNLIAEEILQQKLSESEGERRNWRVGLADLAIRFIDLLADLPHHQGQDSGAIAKILRAVLIERTVGETPAGPWDSDFSRFLRDIPNVDGRRRVLQHLVEKFPSEPHFWAHLGRFYSRVDQDHSQAHDAYDRSIELLPNDTLLHHMAGMGWRAELYNLLDSLESPISTDDESKLFHLINEAESEFSKARTLNRRSEYNYVSQVQMIARVVGTVSRLKGYPHDTLQFLTLHGNDRYRELVDHGQNLLSDLDLMKGGESQSEFLVEVQSRLERLHGRHEHAIERLTNVLDRQGVYKPPLRRAIIRSYMSMCENDLSALSQRRLARVVELANENVEEEPDSDYNLRLWLRAVRAENTISIDRVAEQLAYKRLQNPSLDTTYYLYIMKFLQLEAGDLAVKRDLPELMEECSRLARDLPRTTTSFEWLGSGTGLSALVHNSRLGEWDPAEVFWTNTRQLRSTRGRIALIRDRAGEIELPSGIRVFFVPSRRRGASRYIAGQDIGKEVEFFLGFSYDGLRAWSVQDAE